jgi:outer membrane protein assembly factor BamA
MKAFLVLLIFGFCFMSLAQKSYKLSFANDDYKILKKNVTSNFNDSLEVKSYLNEFRLFAIKKGYLLASLDSIFYKKNETRAHFFLGEKFVKAELSLQKTDLDFLKRNSSLSEKLIRKTNFSPREISNLLALIHQTYVNNGFPFASVSLEKIDFINSMLFAEIKIEKFAEFRIKKINLVGNPVVSPKLISAQIQIKEGDLYNQQKVNEISSKLTQISFISEVKPAEILFTQEGVELFLYLKSKPVSLINGVVGLQPDPIKSKLSLTGELRLKLVNILKKAELFELNWRSIQVQTQSLKIQGVLPNLFRTPFGLDGQFQLYKRDSTFLDLKSTLGLQYSLKNGNYIKMFFRRNSSSILGNSALTSTSFSKLRSVETNFYGLALSKQNLDYLPNPRKGIQLLIEGTVGSRNSLDSLTKIKETTFKFEFNINYYLPLAKRHVLKFSNVTESYFAPSYFENELYRFGGQISLRGFNEEEINASSRSVFGLEYRFLLDKNSYLFAFYDQAWYENKAKNFVTDTPFGFGAGFTFGTAIGNFSVSYALGKQFDNLIQFRDGKIHFGYVAYF